MPSDAKKARDAAKKAAAKQQKRGGKKVEQKEDPATEAQTNGETKEAITNGAAVNDDQIDATIDAAALTLEQIEIDNAKARSVAGALTSNPRGLDHKVESLTVCCKTPF
ncbi:unnamed protein product [Cylicostephanus goldi]|uniref:Uncharacterized protein n=1 Tax=Cylicostephanus goldi TaxID=71465 RepID=A0A3P6SSN6_CYLGO|nr:unnamed protein product [Cylicostephanus goldi]